MVSWRILGAGGAGEGTDAGRTRGSSFAGSSEGWDPAVAGSLGSWIVALLSAFPSAARVASGSTPGGGSAPFDFLLVGKTYVVKVTVYDGFFESTTTPPIEF